MLFRSILAAIYQSSPHILLALKDSKIKTIKDFKNKRVMMTGQAKKDLTFLGMMYSEKLTTDDLIIKKHSYNLEDLVNKKTDLMASYISNEPFRLKEKYNLDSVIFDPKDYGFDFYNDILFTKGNTAREQSMMVQKFKKASLKGWKYAFDNIEETVDIILKHYNTQNKTRKELIYEAKELKRLAYYKTSQIGKIEKMKIEKIYDAYKLIGLVKNQFKIDDFIFNFNTIDQITQKEYDYLKSKQTIKVCVDPNWMPYERINEKGELEGLSKDFFDIFQKKINNKLKLVNTETWTQTLEFIRNDRCDIITLIMKTKSRERYMEFTQTYLELPLVFAAKFNTNFIEDFSALKNKKVGIIKSHAYSEIIKEKYPLINVIEVKDTNEGLRKVKTGAIFGFIGSIAEVSHLIQQDYLAELKIAGKFDDKLHLRVGINKNEPMLKSIFTKIIKTIPQETRDDIIERHLSIKYEERVDYSLLWKTFALFSIIIILILVWLKVINKQKEQTEHLLHKLELAQEKLKESNEIFKKLSETDPLTKLYNRTKIDSILENEHLRSIRFNRNFGIIIIDIDDFKKVNDTYGHQVGDIVLIEFSTILKHNIRHIDYVARWGGEEFFIICPETTTEGTVQLANNLRKKIEEYPFPQVENLTASFGVANFSKDIDLKTLIQNADRALYKAKEEGKNKVSTL